jgi:integrase/recombinase XerD
MAAELQLATPTTAALNGEVLDPAALAVRAAEVAARQRSPETRRTYAAVYRSFAAFLGPSSTAAEVTPETVRAYRDALERAGRAPTTVAKHLSALRGLAEALGADAAVRTVRSARVGRGEPRALTHDEWARLLRMPDRRTRQGKRDLALLHLLGSAGLRRAEAAAVLVADVDERRRASDPRLRQAIARSTSWWVTVRHGKRGRTRAVPLDQDALDAIAAWMKSRPAAASDHLLLSLPRTRQPPKPLTTRDVARIVGRYAAAAGLPEDRRSPHVLRHTFCTHLADAGADVGTIRELARHADIRTTTIYTAVSPDRLEQAIAERTRQRNGLRHASDE